MLEVKNSLGYANKKMNHNINDNVIMAGGYYKDKKANITNIFFDRYKGDTIVEVLIEDNIKMTYLLSDNLFYPKTF